MLNTRASRTTPRPRRVVSCAGVHPASQHGARLVCRAAPVAVHDHQQPEFTVDDGGIGHRDVRLPRPRRARDARPRSVAGADRDYDPNRRSSTPSPCCTSSSMRSEGTGVRGRQPRHAVGTVASKAVPAGLRLVDHGRQLFIPVFARLEVGGRADDACRTGAVSDGPALSVTAAVRGLSAGQARTESPRGRRVAAMIRQSAPRAVMGIGMGQPAWSCRDSNRSERWTSSCHGDGRRVPRDLCANQCEERGSWEPHARRTRRGARCSSDSR